MKHLAYLTKFFWRYRWRFLLGILFVGLANWFRVLQPQMIREALDTVVDQVRFYKEHGGIAAHPEAQSELGKKIGWFGLIVIGLAMMMGVFMFFMRQTIIVTSRLIERDMRNEMFAHYEKLDQGFYKRNNTGDLLSRITEDVSKVRMFLGPTILYGIDLFFLFTLTIYSMINVNPKLAMWALLPMPLLSISIYWVSTLINRRSEKIQQQLALLTGAAQEAYSGIRVVKSYVQEKAMGRWFEGQSEEYRRKTLGLIQVDAFFFPLMLLLVGTSTIITVYVGGLLAVQGKVTPGNIAEFVIYVNMLTWPVTAIGWIASLTQQAAASQKRINEFLQTQPAIENIPGENTPIKGQITFKNVHFTYPDTGIQALNGISFDIKPGEKVAIIGRTGSGKTTIADLLVRLYDVTEGQILLDGRDIKTYDPQHLRRCIGYVPQDVFLFSDTVDANIAFGAPDETTDTVYYAKNAAIHEEIEGLSDGYKTVVGERGVTLSGGQKQRISIARAFAKEPDLVILDDCLSAVDTQTESKILGHLAHELSSRTAIVITHRIYSMIEFDQIFVLDFGKIVASGTHESLLAEGGYYAEIYELPTAP